MHTENLNLPDVIGWELARAREECRALDITASVVLTQPPGKALNPSGGEAHDLSETNYDALRVVAVRPDAHQGVILIACAESW